MGYSLLYNIQNIAGFAGFNKLTISQYKDSLKRMIYGIEKDMSSVLKENAFVNGIRVLIKQMTDTLNYNIYLQHSIEGILTEGVNFDYIKKFTQSNRKDEYKIVDDIFSRSD